MGADAKERVDRYYRVALSLLDADGSVGSVEDVFSHDLRAPTVDDDGLYDLGPPNGFSLPLAALFAFPEMLGSLNRHSALGQILEELLDERKAVKERAVPQFTLIDHVVNFITRDNDARGEELRKDLRYGLFRLSFVDSLFLASESNQLEYILEELGAPGVRTVTAGRLKTALDRMPRADAIAFMERHCDALNAPRMVFYSSRGNREEIKSDLGYLFVRNGKSQLLSPALMDSEEEALRRVRRFLVGGIYVHDLPAYGSSVGLFGVLAELTRELLADTLSEDRGAFYDLHASFAADDRLGALDLLFRRMGVGVHVYGKDDRELVGDPLGLRTNVELRFARGSVLVRRKAVDLSSDRGLDSVSVSGAITQYNRHGRLRDEPLLAVDVGFWRAVVDWNCRSAGVVTKFAAYVRAQHERDVNHKRALLAIGKHPQ